MIIGSEPRAIELRVEPGAAECSAAKPDPLGDVAPTMSCEIALHSLSSSENGGAPLRILTTGVSSENGMEKSGALELF